MSNRPLRLSELLTFYLNEPLVIDWLSSAEDQKLCVLKRRFEHGGTHYVPDPSPMKRPLVSFDSGTAKHLERQNFIEVKSARFDVGEATLRERHHQLKAPAYRPWLESNQGFYPKDDPFVPCELHKHIQVIPGCDVDLRPGDRFVCPYSVVRVIYHRVEGMEENLSAPIEILQP